MKETLPATQAFQPSNPTRESQALYMPGWWPRAFPAQRAPPRATRLELTGQKRPLESTRRNSAIASALILAESTSPHRAACLQMIRHVPAAVQAAMRESGPVQLAKAQE